MALEQFTEQFVANLPIINERTLKDFYESLFRTPAADRIQFIAKTIDEQKDSLPKFDWRTRKDDTKSQHFRTTGNECFVRLEFIEALKYYNKAIVFAVSSENLSISYANRSAVYYELSLFDLCLENIRLATQHNLPERLKAKIEQRREAAVAQFLSKLIIKPRRSYDFRICRPRMARQPFFINCLGQESNQILTKEPLLAGEVISQERPYSQILRQSHIYERCTYCLTNKKYMSMIPCKRCTSAMFCSQYCYQMAKSVFHGIECPIIDGLYHFLPDLMYLGLRTVLISLNECGTTDLYRELLMRCFSNDTNSFNINVYVQNKSYEEMVYSIIHNLDRSWTFSLKHHLATAVIMEQLKSNLKSMFDGNPSCEELLSVSIFHMMQVSMDNGILLEETALTSDSVDDDITIYGCGLFPFASNFEFSCAPNVLFVNCSGTLSGIVIRPIKAGESIVPSIMSQNHFLTDINHRITRMKTFTGELCHCVACLQELEVFTELQPHPNTLNNQPSLIPEEIADNENPRAALRLICNYLNENYNLSYLSWQMGWCVQTLVRVLRKLSDTYDTNTIFTEYSKLRKK